MAGENDFSDGSQVLGKLRVIRKLGAGGIGAVYEVEHELTKHRRALKVLHPRFRGDGELVARFLREASAAGRIGNPHIIETFDAGTLDDGTPWLLMELLDGEPLNETLRRNGRLDVGSACAFLVECCEAVSAAHAAGIVHRDLKPDNLFVVVRGGRPFVKVLDFGISKFDAPGAAPGTALGVTASGVALGTPLYMAPEQMRGARDVDARADVYALGVVAYECLAGGTPYGGESYAELAARVLVGGAAPLDTLRPEVPVGLSREVARAIAVKPDDRFASLADFAAALKPYVVAPESVKAWWERGAGTQEVDQTYVRTAPVSPLPRTDTHVPGAPVPARRSPLRAVLVVGIAVAAVASGARVVGLRFTAPSEEGPAPVPAGVAKAEPVAEPVADARVPEVPVVVAKPAPRAKKPQADAGACPPGFICDL